MDLRKRLLTLALLALSLLRAPTLLAATFEEALVQNWTKILETYRSTREHSAFLRKKGVAIRLVDHIETSLSGSFLASYESDGIQVSRPVLQEVAAELRARGSSEDELAEVIAVKTIDLIGHELRHAIDAAELKRNYGIQFPIGYLEDELSAYFDQAQIIEEAIAQNPVYDFIDIYKSEYLDSLHKELLQAWQSEGLAGLEGYINRWNPVPSVLKADRLYLLSTLQGYRPPILTALERVRKREAELRQGNDPDALREIVANRQALERNLSALNTVIPVVESAPLFEKLIVFSKSRLESLRRER